MNYKIYKHINESSLFPLIYDCLGATHVLKKTFLLLASEENMLSK